MALGLGRSLRRAVAALLLTGALGGCTGPRLDDADLVATLRAELERHGVRADDLRCRSGLRAEVGESVRCTFTVDGQPVDAVARITAVNDVLERSVAQKLEQAGVPAGTASCAGDLPAQVGATVGCTLSGPDGVSTWTVTTTSVDGGKIDYSIEQASPR